MSEENKTVELKEEELEKVSGGNSNVSKITYYLATNGNGEWKENAMTLTSITVVDNSISHQGNTINYTDIYGFNRIVNAIPNDSYSFSNCMFDASTNTFTAVFN